MINKFRENYQQALNEILANGTNRQELFLLCNTMIATCGRQGGYLAYELLNKALDNAVQENEEAVLVDALDALSGQCNPVSFIGTGDYHHPEQAA